MIDNQISIPFVDLRTQYELLEEEIHDSLIDVIKNCDFILGKQVEIFEKSFAAFCDSEYCVGVSSGTEALRLALHAIEVREGDEIITAANTFVATAFAISHVGAKPVFVDINPSTHNMDLNQLEEKITSRTKVIIPVHLYGQPVDMELLRNIADNYHIHVIEDACQAHGATLNRKKVGSFGVMGCFSFYPGKNLGAYGDGGAVVTSDSVLYEKLKMLRNYGSDKKYQHECIGYNSRLDTIQAGILNVKLKYLDEWNKKRFECGRAYHKELDEIKELILPVIKKAGSHVFHLFVVRAEKRDALADFLTQKRVQVGIHYPVPVYAQKAYAHLGLTSKDFPVTERLAREILSLPIYPELSKEQILYITNCIKAFYREKCHG